MDPLTKTKGLFKNKQNKMVNIYRNDDTTPNMDTWSVVSVILMLGVLFWHIREVVGWIDGTTMVRQFGMQTALAEAIIKGPDLLFYATYCAMGLSVIAVVVTLVVLRSYIRDKIDVCDALKISAICPIVTAWAFPVLHAVLDLGATALKVRDTNGFDVGQLGISLRPALVATFVCVAILWVNKRIDTTR